MLARRNVLSLALVCASLTACPPDPVAAPPPSGDAATVDQASPPPADVQTSGDDAATPPLMDVSTPPPADVVNPPPMDASVPPPTDATTTTDVATPPTDRGAQPRDYSRTGPHTVAMWTGTVQGTQGNARAFYPMSTGAERFPLVVFAHGFQLAVNNYDRLLVHLASWGYVVLSVDYPGNLLMVDPRNVPAALSAGRRAFTTGTGTAFPALARVDSSRTVAMGHSLGGKGAVMAVLDDPAFSAALALDPVDDNPSPFGTVSATTPSIAPERMSGLQRPLGLFGATQSRCARLGQTCAPETSDYRQFAAAAPMGATLALWALRDFGHMDFVDPGCGLACSACSGGAAPLDSRFNALKALSVAFLERHARGDTSAQGYIDGAERNALLTSGVLWNGMNSTLPACR